MEVCGKDFSGRYVDHHIKGTKPEFFGEDMTVTVLITTHNHKTDL